MRMKNHCLMIGLFLLGVAASRSMNLKQEIDLKGDWKFEIGDNPEYAESGFNDAHWEIIQVPNAWENEGFPGYDGYAWYRIHFELPKNLKGKALYLRLGRIDDVDRVYLNGRFAGGTGTLPPKYRTAYDTKRIYCLDPDMLKFGGDNVLAIQVYDTQLTGGIYEGQVGIYSRLDVLTLEMDLSGSWKIKTGDFPEGLKPETRDEDWQSIKVPGYWEDEGLRMYDGTAIYRRSVRIDKKLAGEKLILMLGEIDNIDETYFNGTLIGYTGTFPDGDNKGQTNGFHDQERAYFIPPNLIRTNQENVIAVRVFDQGGSGGIHHGYIGITTRNHYLKYVKNKKE